MCPKIIVAVTARHTQTELCNGTSFRLYQCGLTTTHKIAVVISPIFTDVHGSTKPAKNCPLALKSLEYIYSERN